jgi:hypothetical protein
MIRMTSEQKNFIETIGKAAVSYYPVYKILPSLTIAQAILESSWGKSGLAKDCHNYFGMKWRTTCGTDYKEYSTKEQKKDGTYYTVKAKFRKYPNVQAGIKGYYDFLSAYKRYANLKGVTDAGKACDLIRTDGWATSLAYATNLKNLIKTYDLTSYDKLALAGKEVERTTEETPVSAVFDKGDYVVTVSALKVRTGPGISYAQKAFADMTASAQKSNAVKKSTGKACYVKGITFTAQLIVAVSDQECWAKTPSGYVALMYNGRIHVKKA